MEAGRKPSLDDAGRQTLMELHERGFTQQECADALNTSERTIRRESRRLGIAWTGGIKAETREASAKARIDRIREKRAALAEALLEDAEELRKQLFEEYEDSAFVGGQSPKHMKATLSEPKAADQAHIVRSITTILQQENVEPEFGHASDEGIAKGIAELDALEDEEVKISPAAAVARRRTEYCDLGSDCPNKARPHKRGTGPCKADPQSVEDMMS